MVSLMRGRARRPESRGVTQHTVGNAYVLHTEDEISPEAQSLALSVVADNDNDVVVLDLVEGMPVTSWEAMAGILPRHRRRGIRLVACGRQQDAAAMAGQWLSERLGRPVVAPYGNLVRGAGGALFVHSHANSGWMRFKPGGPIEWDAKRYPTPKWDRAATESRASSSTAEIEPLPGGVWLHDVRDEPLIARHRERLTLGVPSQIETMTVLLGCPGTEPLSLDDVMRFWRDLDEDTRIRARFVQYGDVRLPEGESFGQTLADMFGTNVVTYTGVPMGVPQRYEIRTVRSDGEFGWPPFVGELGFWPRLHPNSRPRRPSVLTYRPPLRWTEEIAPRVYWYAQDAVIEVVQSGLWLRSPEEPPNAERVRGAQLDPEGNTVVFDDMLDERTDRMRGLAQDLLARLDRPIGAGSGLLPASVLVPGAKPAGRAEAHVALEEYERYSATVVSASVSAPVEVAPPQPVAGMMSTVVSEIESAPAPAAAELESAPAAPEPAPHLQQLPEAPPGPGGGHPATVTYGMAESFPAGRPALPPPDQRPVVEDAAPVSPAPASPAPLRAERGPAEAFEPVSAPLAPPLSEPDAPAAPSEPVGSVSTVDDVPPPIEPGPPVEPVGAAYSIAAFPLERRPPAVSEPPAPAAPDLDVLRVLNPTAPATAPPPVLDSPPALEPVRAEEPDPAPGRSAAEGNSRLQPVPAAAASALVAGRTLVEERAWLRKSLSRDFDAMASSVSRILSEHPGMQRADGKGNDDVLVDSVAIRLYLSRRGQAIDAGLRSGTKGPHVPFARCAVSGLSRLPSHRGTTIFTMTPAPGELDLYRQRRLVTDWGFVNALTAPCANQDGEVDVLIWSMTARRTALLEPENPDRVADRVLFAPGTNFKVLDLEMAVPGERRGFVLMREIGANEIDDDGRVDPNRLSLDELAVASLRRSVERWAAESPVARTGKGSAERFGALPGLVKRA